MDQLVTFVFPIIRRDQILVALESLYKHTPYKFAVIVVDQTIPDERFEALLRPYCNLHIKPKYNLGFAEAANIGIRVAPTEYIAVVNDDVVFFQNPYPKGWFEGILRTFENFPKCGAVSPMSPREPGWGWGIPGYVYHCRNCGARYIDEKRPCKCDNYEPLDLEELQKDVVKTQLMIDAESNAMIDGIACWCPVMRRDALDDIGLFDERFRDGGGEDYDWNARCAQAGYRAVASSYSWVYHMWGRSKDSPDGHAVALPSILPPWNKLSTKGFGDEGLWHPDVDCWGNNCERTDKEVWRASL